MPFVLRQEGDTENPLLPVAYGKQSTRGRLVYYDKGGATGGQTKFICILGMGEFDGVDRVYYGGNVLPEFDSSGTRIWQFHPGTQSTGFSDPIQGRPTFFPELDFTFSEIAYIEVMLPVTFSTEDQDEPSKMFFLVRGRKVKDYTLSGLNLVEGSSIFTANNALIAADIIVNFMKLPLNRIHGPSLLAFRDACDVQLPWVGGNNTVQEPSYVNITGSQELGNGGITRTLTGEGWNQAGARTRSYLSTGNDGYYEVTAGEGTFVAGWTNSTTVNSADEIILGIQCNLANVYSLVVNGVTTAKTAWSPGNVFRFAIEGGQFKIYHNGVALPTAGFPSVPATELRGGIAFFHDGASITGSTFFPASTVDLDPKTTPRYEAHVVFTSDTEATSALQAVMNRAPGCHWQDVNGRIKFITTPTLTDISGGGSLPSGGRALIGNLVYDPTQVIVRSNIVEKSFSAYRKSLFDKPNYLRGSFRNRDSEFYDNGASAADRKDLRAQAKALIDPGLIPFGMGTQSLTDRIVETQMRLTSDLDLYVTVKGQANTHRFAKGDVVELSHDVPGWRETAPPKFLIIEETFEPTVGEGGTADDRTFTLQLYTEEFYSDTSHGPVSGVVVSSFSSPFIPPPVALDLDLTEGTRTLPDETVLPVINGIVQFAPFGFKQRGQVWIKRPGESDYSFTNIVLIPDATTNLASFSIDGVSAGQHFIRVVTTTVVGVYREPIEAHITQSITISAPATSVLKIFDNVVPKDYLEGSLGLTMGVGYSGAGSTHGTHVWRDRGYGYEKVATSNKAASIGHTTDNSLSWLGNGNEAGPWTSVDFGADVITFAKHGFINNQTVTVRNTGGALPGGLSAGTVYYIKSATTNTFQLSLTSGGAAINLSSSGSGSNYATAYGILWVIKDGGADFVDATLAEIEAGKNNYFVGREMIGVQNWTNMGSGLWKGEDLVRGLQFTDIFQGTHTAQEDVLQLDENILFVPIEQRDIDTALNFKAVTFGQLLGDVTAIPFTPRGDSVRAYRVDSINAYKTSNDITIQIVGNSRVPNPVYKCELWNSTYTTKHATYTLYPGASHAAMLEGADYTAGIEVINDWATLIQRSWGDKNNIYGADVTGQENALATARTVEQIIQPGTVLDFTFHGVSTDSNLNGGTGVFAVGDASFAPSESTVSLFKLYCTVTKNTNQETTFVQEYGALKKATGGPLEWEMRFSVIFSGNEIRVYKNRRGFNDEAYWVTTLLPAAFPLRMFFMATWKAAFTGITIQSTPSTIISERDQIAIFSSVQSNLYTRIYEVSPLLNNAPGFYIDTTVPPV